MTPLVYQRLPAYGIVEILIALMVVGFLLKGTLGSFFYRFDDVKVKASMGLYQKILTATLRFQDRYGYLPGDYPEASQNFGPHILNGDGSGFLTGDGLGSPQSSKAALFWLHLSAAHIFEDAGQMSAAKPLAFGSGAPSSDFEGAGFTIVYNPEGWGGHWLALGAVSGSTGLGGALTPDQARLFLRHMGASDEQSGSIRIAGGIGHARCFKSNVHHKSTEKSCIVYFRLTE